jgi:hypothetical protein
MPKISAAAKPVFLQKDILYTASSYLTTFFNNSFVMNRQHLEALLQFIRQHRSNEANFEMLTAKLEAESGNQGNTQEYKKALDEIKIKQAEQYRQNKHTGASAWPEFENFVSEFEKTITDEINNRN